MARRYLKLILLALILSAIGPTAFAQDKLTNVSYDPTREFYHEYDLGFKAYWKAAKKHAIAVDVSNGGSGKQAQSVIDGVQADIVTLGLAYDIDRIAKSGLIKPGWQKAFPFKSTPYTSTIVFVVRSGNPKHIHDWADLIKPGVQIVTPNPKTSGGARWAFLAAYGYALKASGGNQSYAKGFVTKLYKNVPVLASGARGATDAFLQQNVGDVLLSWENEGYLTVNNLARGKTELVDPSISILAEPPVAVVDANVDAHHTREAATAYLQGLYSVQGQSTAAKYYYRPRITAGVPKKYLIFPKIKLFTIDDTFGGWAKAQPEFFGDGGVFDQIYAGSAAH